MESAHPSSGLLVIQQKGALIVCVVAVTLKHLVSIGGACKNGSDYPTLLLRIGDTIDDDGLAAV